jgi:hypothetical protein
MEIGPTISMEFNVSVFVWSPVWIDVAVFVWK